MKRKAARGSKFSRRALLSLPVAAFAAPAAVSAAAGPSRGWADDPLFGGAVIDKDEWRAKPRRHRYVHGGFAGTDTRFVVALPETPVYQGRFVQFVQGGNGGNELTGYNRGQHELAFAQGGYYVESNQGHLGNDMSGLRGDLSIFEWRANAQAARFARKLAEAMYGSAPHHGYTIGGSGGGMRSIDGIENAPDIWQGAVAWMINRNGLSAYHWSLAAWASIVLEARLPALAQAGLEGADAFSVLQTDAERAALDTLYRAGYPRRAEDQLGPNPLTVLGIQRIEDSLPSYFVDFWKTPGFEGADNAPEMTALMLDVETEVEAVLSEAELTAAEANAPAVALTDAGARSTLVAKAPVAIRIKGDIKPLHLMGATLRLESGAAKGRHMLCTGSVAGALTANRDPAGFVGVRPGDRLRIDNRTLLAFVFYHRHVVDQRYVGMRPFFENGRPRYAQSKVGIDVWRTPKASYRGKVILLQHLLDCDALPSGAEPYVQGVRRNLGPKVDESFRIWWMDNAQHGVPEADRVRYIDYRGACAQALSDIIVWTEKGQAPPPSSAYGFDDMTQVVLPARAAERRGIQATVTLTANGARTVAAKVGESVSFEAHAETPPGAGRIVSLAFDFAGKGAFASLQMLPGPAPSTHTARTSYAFGRPGRHIVTVRVETERTGRPDGFRVANLARVLVVVT